MGLYYYAVGKESRKAVALGKGDWDEIQGKKFESVQVLAQACLEHLKESCRFHESCINLEYASEVADKLWVIGKEFEVVSENNQAESYRGVLIVASVYTEDSDVGTQLSVHLEP